MALSGFGWLTFLVPVIANVLLTYVEGIGIMLWLLVRGVNSQRWTERAAMTARR